MQAHIHQIRYTSTSSASKRLHRHLLEDAEPTLHPQCTMARGAMQRALSVSVYDVTCLWSIRSLTQWYSRPTYTACAYNERLERPRSGLMLRTRKHWMEREASAQHTRAPHVLSIHHMSTSRITYICTLNEEAVSKGKMPALAVVCSVYIPPTARGKNGWQRRDA